MDQREELGTGAGPAAGDRCRGFGKGQGFSLQNAFKQTEREPDPRKGIGRAGDTRGAPRGVQGWRDEGGEMRDSRA